MFRHKPHQRCREKVSSGNEYSIGISEDEWEKETLDIDGNPNAETC